MISESRNKKIVPTLLINDIKGKNIRTYNLPVGAHLMVNDGEKVKEGKILVLKTQRPIILSSHGRVQGGDGPKDLSR